MTRPQFLTQILALIAIVAGWIDPSGALNGSAQTVVTIGASLVVAVIQLVHGIENAARIRTLAAATPSPVTIVNHAPAPALTASTAATATSAGSRPVTPGLAP